MIDQLLAKTPPLEFQVQTLSSSLEDSAAEIRAKVLSLERTTAAKDDYKKKNSRLRKKLEASEAELKALKTMAENIVSTSTRAPELMDAFPTRSREIIQKNMLKASSLTLAILKSLYLERIWWLRARGLLRLASGKKPKHWWLAF